MARQRTKERMRIRLRKNDVVEVISGRDAGKRGKVKVVAFDAPKRIVDDIRSGLMDVAIAQHPAAIGYYGVVTAYAALTGQSVPTAIGTGFTVMDASNIDDPEILKFVYSD